MSIALHLQMQGDLNNSQISINNNSNVLFDATLFSSGGISYDSSTGEITINEPGLFFIEWSVSTGQVHGGNLIGFDVETSTGQSFASYLINSGELTGNALISVDSTVDLSLRNISGSTVSLILAPIVANLVIHSVGLDDGNQGPTGPTGATGAQGIQGVTGDPGATGAQGIQGLQGLPGEPGATGPQGIQGNAGATGPQGIQGSAGATGPQGIQGNAGVTGPQGIQGNAGVTGPQGIQGNTGITGPQGIQGMAGVTGPQGIQGNNGSTGPQGIQGNVGPQGLQGIQGNVGPQGIQGLQGLQGITGPNALSASTTITRKTYDLPITVAATGGTTSFPITLTLRTMRVGNLVFAQLLSDNWYNLTGSAVTISNCSALFFGWNFIPEDLVGFSTNYNGAGGISYFDPAPSNFLALDVKAVSGPGSKGTGFSPYGNSYNLPATLQLGYVNPAYPSSYITAHLRIDSGFVIPPEHFIKFSGIGFAFSN